MLTQVKTRTVTEQAASVALDSLAIPLRTGNGLNGREHHMARARRVKAEREAAHWMLQGRIKPALPCLVTLTRIAPSNGLDDDNLAGALKAVRDQVALWLGVDDRDRKAVRYAYEQRRGPWAVEVAFAAMPVALEAVA